MLTPETLEQAIIQANRGVLDQFGAGALQRSEGIIRAAVTAAAPFIEAAAQAVEVQSADHELAGLLGELLKNAPERFDRGDAAAEAVDYVRWLEATQVAKAPAAAAPAAAPREINNTALVTQVRPNHDMDRRAQRPIGFGLPPPC